MTMPTANAADKSKHKGQKTPERICVPGFSVLDICGSQAVLLTPAQGGFKGFVFQIVAHMQVGF